jgi:hypothetical protein
MANRGDADLNDTDRRAAASGESVGRVRGGHDGRLSNDPDDWGFSLEVKSMTTQLDTVGSTVYVRPVRIESAP